VTPAVVPVAPSPTGPRLRLDAIDFVRGAVMILMVLDHTRDFVHSDGLLGDPLNPATTTVWIYLTRWFTHMCAPTFVLLAGLGIGLRRQRAGSAGLAWFVVTRGLWLIVMEVTVVRIIGWGSVDYRGFLAHLQVIWAIGMSMVLLGALVRLPIGVVGAIGAAIALGHNLLDGIQVPAWMPWNGVPAPGVGGALWMLLHQSGFFPVGGQDGPVVWSHYPLLPWFGVLCLGYALASVYAWPADRRRRALTTAALVMPLVFLVLRAWNLYGDPRPWTPQPTAIQTAMAFLNVQKYGPSLDFLLIMLPAGLLGLARLEGTSLVGGLGGAVVTFGRVPFFFYVLQWIASHLAGIVVTAIYGGELAPYFMHLIEILALPQPPRIGGPFWLVYVCWVLIVLALYPLCRWFAGVKARRRDWWLSYV
jgi:uncharacterized membrane protein